jgi:hypothetical protein
MGQPKSSLSLSDFSTGRLLNDPIEFVYAYLHQHETLFTNRAELFPPSGLHLCHVTLSDKRFPWYVKPKPNTCSYGKFHVLAEV